jgi:precorrin-4 C11-methyltransferase
MVENTSGKVIFVGAGPGDPELITVKGQKLIASADVILYAGSLVAPEMLNYASKNATLYNSAGMKLADQVTLMVEAAQKGKTIVRMHTGDPSIFGAIDEQIRALEIAGVAYEIVPGVSAAFAAAAALGIEYTRPEITQTLILTRASGRTPVPELENLRELAKHRSSLAIFLSTGMIATVVDELLSAGYSEETPIAVVYRASWPDQKILRGTLSDIARQLENLELTHQGLIIISPSLVSERSTPSHLYGNFQQENTMRSGKAILALTAPSIRLARSLQKQIEDSDLFIPEHYLLEEDRQHTNVHGFRESIRQILQDAFQRYDSLICIMASGIVVRELAPLLKNKHSDPAVVVMDSIGKFAVSLLSGHEGGANQLAQQLANLTGGQAVITTASDQQEIPALDVLAKEKSWKIDPQSNFPALMAAMVNGESVCLVHDKAINLPAELKKMAWAAIYTDCVDALSGHCQHMLILTCQTVPDSVWKNAPESVVYYPPLLMVGIGCNRGTSCEEIQSAIYESLSKANLSIESVACLASIEDKADEQGMLETSQLMSLPIRFYTHNEIQQVKHIPTPSEYVQNTLGVAGVAEPAALLASGALSLLISKQKFTNVTVSVAMKGSQICAVQFRSLV